MLNNHTKKCCICDNEYFIDNMFERNGQYLCEDCYKKLKQYSNGKSLSNYSIEELKKLFYKNNNNTNEITSLNNKKPFWKDIKNIVIIVLSLFLLCTICAYQSPAEYENQVNELNIQIQEYTNQLTNTQQQITKLTNDKEILETENKKLEDEKQELNNKIEELSKKVSSTDSTTSSTAKTTTSSSSNTSTDTTNSDMVWVGNTGNKYHKQNCSTLKGNGHQITMEQALSEGRTACKLCYK